MISASKTTLSHFNLKILRPKVTQNIKNLRKKFCESAPSFFNIFFDSLFFLLIVILRRLHNNLSHIIQNFFAGKNVVLDQITRNVYLEISGFVVFTDFQTIEQKNIILLF